MEPRWWHWLRYSGVSIKIVVNPWHWRWLPQAYSLGMTWEGPDFRGVCATWLMIEATAWIDNGTW